MNQSPQPNLLRGIAAYLNPVREMAIREEMHRHMANVKPKDRVGTIDEFVKRFGRETVRAVLGEDAV